MIFTCLYFLADGIYPELARFVKTMSEPMTVNHKRFAGWQESSRKDVERGFGVLQRKFHILVKDFEQWYIDDIKAIVECCIIMDNMMVEERLEEGNCESFVLSQSQVCAIETHSWSHGE